MFVKLDCTIFYPLCYNVYTVKNYELRISGLELVPAFFCMVLLDYIGIHGSFIHTAKLYSR